jgi:hypothetical protein
MQMVKGISRQVIMVHAPDKQLFEQAIFILKDNVIGKDGITDEMLLKEANRLIKQPQGKPRRNLRLYGPIWALGGALVTGMLWILTVVV